MSKKPFLGSILRDEIITLARQPERLLDLLRHRLSLFLGPTITGFSPASGYGGTLVEITGVHFGPKREDNQVHFGGRAGVVVSASPTLLRVLAPPDVETSHIQLKVGSHTVTSPHLFKLLAYPKPGSEADGPPIAFEGDGQGAAGDQPSTGTLRVAVALVNPTDRVPANPTTARDAVVTAWDRVHTFYEQQSYGQLHVNADVTATWKTLSGDTAAYLNSAGDNIDGTAISRLAAECAQACVDAGLDLNDYGMLACVIFLNGQFIRAWGNLSTQHFQYDDNATGTHINITTTQELAYIEIQESADWGRFAHETGHNISASPSFSQSDDETATLGEDVYASDLVDPSAASAQRFEIMGDHDRHPGFSAYHLDKLGWIGGTNILDLQWDRNAFSHDYDLVAHGLTQNTAGSRYHMLRIRVSNGLYYYVEVRQRPPAASAQIFDPDIPLGASSGPDGGVVVYKILSDVNNNNQQWRYVTLLHDEHVLATGERASDPARALTITVLDDNIASSPRVCRVRVEWAQAITDDPSGAFDLRIDPWDSSYQTGDIWIDRMPFGTFDQPTDAQGRPTGNGDKPRPQEINHLWGRVHCDGAAGATNVRLTYYAVEPPGVGDNGNWTPLATKVIPSISAGGFADAFVNWVPAVGRHTCLKLYAEQQLGEITGGNNFAQENVFAFEAPASSVPDAVFIRVALRNPSKERRCVRVTITGVPFGYRVQFPHAWVWLEGLAEKTFTLAVIPTLEYRLYTSKEPGIARNSPVHVRGDIPRDYSLPLKGGLPPSVMSRIGGILTRVTPKKRVRIELAPDRDHHEKGSIAVHGAITPAVPDQRVRVDLTDPHDRLRVAVVQTDSAGAFHAAFDLTTVPSVEHKGRHDREEPQHGEYRAQAAVVDATEAAEATSNVVVIKR
ncbi:IPT/TIG domain-containing protein [Sorangium sp. So ce1000]|uniref:IPT/TIG domain-containing protein n=1 Tax=Sorangium sp. So ce1000 TaxID=3133325 RepID=UPI003F623182